MGLYPKGVTNPCTACVHVCMHAYARARYIEEGVGDSWKAAHAHACPWLSVCLGGGSVVVGAG